MLNINMDDFFVNNRCEERPVCSEGMRDIREGLRDIRLGIKDLNEGLCQIRTCEIRDGADRLREAVCDIAEGAKDILEGLRDLCINEECKEFCEIKVNIKEIFEGLRDIEDGIEDVERKHPCGCEDKHFCDRDQNQDRQRRLQDREEKRFCEGIKDIQEGLEDIQMGFNNLVDDLRELFFIPDDKSPQIGCVQRTVARAEVCRNNNRNTCRCASR